MLTRFYSEINEKKNHFINVDTNELLSLYKYVRHTRCARYVSKKISLPQRAEFYFLMLRSLYLDIMIYLLSSSFYYAIQKTQRCQKNNKKILNTHKTVFLLL